VNTQIRLKGDKPDPVKREPRRKKPRDLTVLREVVKAAAVVGIAAVVYYRFGLLPMERPEGNRSMLALCKWELAAWRSYQANRPEFNFHRLSDDEKRRAIIYGLNQDLLIRTNFLWGTATNREIVIVCRRLYDNVPTPVPWNLFHHNPAHAVGYSDGTTGLISPEKFDNLFLYGFSSLWGLGTNSNFEIFKP
jgi:hypothetical protein